MRHVRVADVLHRFADAVGDESLDDAFRKADPGYTGLQSIVRVIVAYAARAGVKLVEGQVLTVVPDLGPKGEGNGSEKRS